MRMISHDKSKMRLLMLISVVTWLVTSSSAIAHGKKDYTLTRNVSTALQAVTASANSFSSEFLSTVGEAMKDNFVCSPISMFLLLSMASYGARGNTQKQLRTTLALLNHDDNLALRGFQAFIECLNSYEVSDVNLANKIFFSDDFNPQKLFARVAKIAFQSELQSINFTDSVFASRYINTWVEAHTNHLIKDLTTPDSLDPDTDIVLVSAIYFRGTWAEQFNSSLTKPGSFNINRDTIKTVPMMQGVGNHQYGALPEMDATFLRLHYLSDWANDSMSMFIILPDKINGLDKVENNIDKITINELIRRSAEYKVSVTLPKFKIESAIPLNEVLKQMGLTDMFSDKANFNGIAKCHSVKVSKVIQKTFIEINESGTEAAAAGSLGLSNRQGSSNRRKTFIADHPFLIIIATTSEHPVTLFAGRYKVPQDTQ